MVCEVVVVVVPVPIFPSAVAVVFFSGAFTSFEQLVIKAIPAISVKVCRDNFFIAEI